MKHSPDLLTAVAKRLGHPFANLDLLSQALTHRSFVNESRHANADNQRLEFLGDAILGHIIAEALYHHYPNAPEGLLSKLKARLVCENTLAQLANDLALGDVLRLGRGEERSGGRHKPSLLADTYEAIIAAVLLDAGFTEAKRFVLTHHAPLISDPALLASHEDPKSQLQERTQHYTKAPPVYHVSQDGGPEHAPSFIAEVHLDGRRLGTGRGNSKKEAEQAAARNALTHYPPAPTSAD